MGYRQHSPLHHVGPSPMGALHPPESREGFVEGQKEAEDYTLS